MRERRVHLAGGPQIDVGDGRIDSDFRKSCLLVGVFATTHHHKPQPPLPEDTCRRETFPRAVPLGHQVSAVQNLL